MKALWLSFTVAALALLPSLHAFSAPDSNWHIARTSYPAHVQFHTFPPTNRMADQVFGHFHYRSYAALQRQDGVGVVRSVRHVLWWQHHRIVMQWQTVGSAYPTPDLARAAAADLHLPLRTTPLLVAGSRVVNQGHGVGILHVLVRGAMTIEQYSTVTPRLSHVVKTMRHYDTLQRTAWVTVLARITAPTPTTIPTATLTPTSVPTATNTPTATPTATPTSTPTNTPTPAPTPTSTPDPLNPLCLLSTTTVATHVGSDGSRIQVAIDTARVGTQDAVGTPPSAGKVFLWLHVTLSYQGGAAIAPSPYEFQIVEPNGATDTAHNAQNSWPPDVAGPALPTQLLQSGQTESGWVEIELPKADGVYTLQWQPDPTSQQWITIQQYGIDMDGMTVTPLLSYAGCGGILPLSAPTPTSTPTQVIYVPPTTAPVTYGCIPTEGDNDNDDHGKPAASWDHDGCP